MAVPNSLILTMGAGDVYKIAELLLEDDERCRPVSRLKKFPKLVKVILT